MLLLLLSEVFPEGLPPAYVFVATVQLKGPASREKFDLWRVLSKDQEVQVSVTLNGLNKSVIFTTTSMANTEQKITFDAQGIQVSNKNFKIYKIQHLYYSVAAQI